ncbi:NADH-ubiquinone oxidoreductase chain L [Labilithrix luteola]|uniref:NADH-ubiquinone oxidoreductase chain L n=1 Tax=Labilithrix luteola TaxID=1391654 RepID=A0A0K1Q887_9BACT|nr:NADH-quinone oxidoreductase subunit L [Labilithrix luteola]AKV02026.1 NADH-ubiquinone oxidoreductase chain L [Labilithrix luteola]
MKALFSLFPADNFSLIAVVMLMPLLGAFVNGVFGQRLGKPAVRLMALSAIGISFVAAVVTFFALNGVIDASKTTSMVDGHEVTHHAHAKLFWTAWEWMRTSRVVATAGGAKDISVPIDLKFSVDALSGVMMLVVTGVGFLIHVYASSYMEADKAYWRFFAYLNLFVFSMLVLILGDNLAVLFVGWEGVGLCSYLLIGFWYTKTPNAAAGKKAFIANRIGDFGLLVAMFLLVHYTGALDWTGIATNARDLLTPGTGAQVHLWPIGGGQFQDLAIGSLKIPLSFLQPDKPWTITAATAVSIALFLGCTGKSAQIPLYVWLPDAMAGPTPVSALIHAATMVTAGIYLVCRLSFVFVMSPAVMTIIAFTGVATALFAATIALVQNDIKKVLAYSTVSQLGFMFLGVGVGAFTAGFFHVFTHAFFKACLFLGAGSVIHSMHARIHDDDKSQDMRNMGGLRKFMPLTYGTFAAATLAIIGFPLTSGWFSKDEIIASALVNKTTSPYAAELAARKIEIWTAPGWVPWVLWAMAVTAATLTAFYMCRCLFLTFWGDFRGWTIGRPSEDAHAHDEHGDGEGEEADDHHHEEDLTQPGAAPHESPRPMTIPLLILGTASIVAGLLLNPAAIKLFNHHFNFLPMEHWLEPVFEEATKGVGTVAANEAGKHHLEILSLVAALCAFLVGSGVAYWVYVLQAGKPAAELAKKVGGLYNLLLDKWRVDEAYDKTVVAGVDALADTATSVDQGIIDFVLARLTALIVAALGTILRLFQNGVVHVYAAVMVVGMAALGWFFIEPHADVNVTESSNGDYVLSAAPGIGYGYRWYPDSKGAPQAQAFTGTDQLKLHLDEGKSQTVKVEVRNAFGRITTKEIPISRPKVEKPQQIQLGER